MLTNRTLRSGQNRRFYVLLEFQQALMYYLIAKQTQVTNEGNLQDIHLYQQKQKSFLCVHLARWLLEFAENVQKNAQTEFYKKLARLTEIFVQKDLDTLQSCQIGEG